MHRHASLVEKTTTAIAAPRARASPPTVAPAAAAAPGGAAVVQRMQRLVGNQAVMRMLGVPRPGVTAPVQRMDGGDDEGAPADMAPIRQRIEQAFHVTDEDYQLVTDQGNYVGGTGNCHGYSLQGDLDAYLELADPQEFLDAYGEQVITVFTRGGEVAHSAAGHGDDCVHKVYMPEGWGPLIRAGAGAVAGGYDARYALPGELAALEDWIAALQEQQENEADYERVLNTFAYYLDDHGYVLDGLTDEAWDYYRNLPNDDPTAETVAAILQAMQTLAGETYASAEEFLQAHEH